MDLFGPTIKLVKLSVKIVMSMARSTGQILRWIYESSRRGSGPVAPDAVWTALGLLVITALFWIVVGLSSIH
jgi:hypothetical protein